MEPVENEATCDSNIETRQKVKNNPEIKNNETRKKRRIMFIFLKSQSFAVSSQ